MEHEAPSFRFNKRARPSSSGLNLVQEGYLSTNNVENGTEEQRLLCPLAMPEQDLYMPITSVTRNMRQILPSHAKISDDAKLTIQLCLSEFINFITSEANDFCQRELRKKITAEDVLSAMDNLGYHDYVNALTVFLDRYRHKNKSDPCLLLGEILLGNRTSADYGPPIGLPSTLATSYGPTFPMGPILNTGFLDPTKIGGFHKGLPSTLTTSYQPTYPMGPNLNSGFIDPTKIGGFCRGMPPTSAASYGPTFPMGPNLNPGFLDPRKIGGFYRGMPPTLEASHGPTFSMGPNLNPGFLDSTKIGRFYRGMPPTSEASYGPTFPLEPNLNPGFPDPTTIGGCYRDVSAAPGSSAWNALTKFHPFARLN